MTEILKLFKGRKLVIATMHQKELIISPLIEKSLGVVSVVAKGLNTDKFGTFSGEIKRAGNQLEAARKKAYAAMKLADTDLAIASEGSFDTDSTMPFLQSNLELVLFIDKKNGLEIKGHYRTFETNIDGIYVSTVDEALAFAQKHKFPKYGIIVRYSAKSTFTIHKDISDINELAAIVKKMLSRPFIKKVFIETDMRAHKNPLRRKAIKCATRDLIKNICSTCPECATPGFVIHNFEKGLPCAVCTHPTDLPLYDIYLCSHCNFSTKKKVTQYGDAADPTYCGFCNP